MWPMGPNYPQSNSQIFSRGAGCQGVIWPTLWVKATVLNSSSVVPVTTWLSQNWSRQSAHSEPPFHEAIRQCFTTVPGLGTASLAKRRTGTNNRWLVMMFRRARTIFGPMQFPHPASSLPVSVSEWLSCRQHHAQSSGGKTCDSATSVTAENVEKISRTF